MFADEKKLIEACINGEDKGYRQLYRRYSQRVYQIAYRYFNNPDDASDITQEVFLRVFKNIATYRGEARLSTWMHRIAVNLCLDELRRRQRNPETSLDGQINTPEGGLEWQIKDPGPGPHQLAESGQRMEVLKKHLASLPEEQRAAVILRDISNLSYQEIARVLECNLGTVKSRINRGRLTLRDLLIREGELFGLAYGRKGEGRDAK